MEVRDFTRYVESRFADGTVAVPVDDVIQHFMSLNGTTAEEVEDALAIGLILRRFEFRDADRTLVPRNDDDLDRMASRMRDIAAATDFMAAINGLDKKRNGKH